MREPGLIYKESLPFRQNHRPLDYILQLADVARPIVWARPGRRGSRPHERLNDAEAHGHAVHKRGSLPVRADPAGAPPWRSPESPTVKATPTTVIARDSEAIQTKPQLQTHSLGRFALLAMTESAVDKRTDAIAAPPASH